MPLESCMLVLDNSEFMRNGDYAPTRFQAQSQAVSTVFSAKTDANPESGVGLMTMAGKAPSLLVTPTNDIGKLLSALGKATIGGSSDFQTAVQIAQLALKHRENKNQRQRIVVFVGSPLHDSQESLVKLGKRLRKNNVLVDIVTFGQEGMENETKLNALIEAAGGGDSHLVSVPPGPHLLSDVIISSPILYDPDLPGAAASAGQGGLAGDDFDPNSDPELAMAIRMSLQEAEQAAAAGGSSTAAQTAQGTSREPETAAAPSLPAGLTQPLVNENDADIPMAPGDVTTGGADDDDDEELRRAMALSRGEDVAMGEDNNDDDEDEDEEAAIARAIAMSLEEQKDEEKK